MPIPCCPLEQRLGPKLRARKILAENLRQILEIDPWAIILNPYANHICIADRATSHFFHQNMDLRKNGLVFTGIKRIISRFLLCGQYCFSG
uniref:Uncharacterized protein n=1 Tax=Utricularia reniformis TaxID=192314 RepID=A0A1Y0B0E7_9LAMI|nr:hypothetical protein AEK19_MT0596 [Utricularia reniformis]ART30851.1 hypothetical protein AEK19_MT0596 [Utricularia reniformis]